MLFSRPAWLNINLTIAGLWLHHWWYRKLSKMSITTIWQRHKHGYKSIWVGHSNGKIKSNISYKITIWITIRKTGVMLLFESSSYKSCIFKWQQTELMFNKKTQLIKHKNQPATNTVTYLGFIPMTVNDRQACSTAAFLDTFSHHHHIRETNVSTAQICIQECWIWRTIPLLGILRK